MSQLYVYVLDCVEDSLSNYDLTRLREKFSLATRSCALMLSIAIQILLTPGLATPSCQWFAIQSLVDDLEVSAGLIALV